METAKRARKAETPKQPSLSLRLRAPYLYPDPERSCCPFATPVAFMPSTTINLDCRRISGGVTRGARSSNSCLIWCRSHRRQRAYDADQLKELYGPLFLLSEANDETWKTFWETSVHQVLIR